MSAGGPHFNHYDYRLLPEEKRYEIIEGELLVRPTPPIRHQMVLVGLLYRLYPAMEGERLGTLLIGPVAVVLEYESVVEPDILFVSTARQEILRSDGAIHGAPDLVVEILSPSTAKRDQVVKRKLYQKYGVREFWIVDPEAQTIEVCALGDGTSAPFGKGALLTSPLLPNFQVPLDDIFVG